MTSNKLDIFSDNFPSAEDFYKDYWGKKPFIARGVIDQRIFETLIDAESLAALSMEDDVKSRIVVTAPKGGKWTCDHGPFDEDKFAALEKDLGDKNWSLLVQNVEQYHTDTAKLLQSFNFSPRWLMDDIMVSYSTAGGSVGPHTDSYHVFLVQGMGRRKWTVGTAPIHNEEYIEGSDLKVLKEGVQGEEIEVSIGDVIYLPPHFAHEGITTEDSLTFSVGFLGPKLSEMFIEYGYHLEQLEKDNKRFDGKDLNKDSAGFIISAATKESVQDSLVNALQLESFSKWLAGYFSTPTYDDPENIPERDEPLSSDELFEILQNNEELYKPDHIKLSVTTSTEGASNLAVYGAVIEMNFSGHEKLVGWLTQNKKISIADIEIFNDKEEPMQVITYLYNKNVLFFEDEDLTVS